MKSKSLLFAATSAVVSVVAMAPVAASAATVTFEDKTAFSCTYAADSSGGLNYTVPFAACYYSSISPADFPTTPTSTVMANGYNDTTFTLTAGGAFNVSSVDLAFGPFTHSGATSDTTLVTGSLLGGGTLSTTLTVGYPFQTFALNWAGLSSITFSALQSNSEYLAFDNINYAAGGPAVPEPATWGMMILGFGVVGAASRYRRRAIKVAFAA